MGPVGILEGDSRRKERIVEEREKIVLRISRLEEKHVPSDERSL